MRHRTLRLQREELDTALQVALDDRDAHHKVALKVFYQPSFKFILHAVESVIEARKYICVCVCICEHFFDSFLPLYPLPLEQYIFYNNIMISTMFGLPGDE